MSAQTNTARNFELDPKQSKITSSSSSPPKNLLILDATGKIGGNVIKAILNSPAEKRDQYHIYAVKRDTYSPAAQRLHAFPSIITPVFGDSTESTELFDKIGAPVWGVFIVGIPGEGGDIPANEEAQAKALIDASVKHGVSRIIYSSSDRGGEAPTSVPQFASKHAIEEYLQSAASRSSGQLSYTIIRPTFILDDLEDTIRGRALCKSLTMYLGENKTLDVVATSDIGWFGAQGFLEPEDEIWKNKAVGIAGDRLTCKGMKEAYRRLKNAEMPSAYWLSAQLGILRDNNMTKLLEWLGSDGFKVDVDLCKKLHPKIRSFEVWLRSESTFTG